MAGRRRQLLIRRLDQLQYRFEMPKPPARQFVLPPIEERSRRNPHFSN